MALPNLFASVTTIVTSQFDQNFTAVGLLGVMPTTVTGTNAIVMTPVSFANAPTLTAYADYMVFSGIVAATNTAATTIQVGSLAALPAYKDTAAGASALSGGELVAGNAFYATYDSALNSGNGGFHIFQNMRPNFTTLRVNSGATITRLLSSTASITFTSIVPGGSNSQTIAVTGASIGDVVALGLATVTTGIVYDGHVETTGVVNVRATNITSGSTITPAAQNIRALVTGAS